MFVWSFSAKEWSYSILGMLHGLVAGLVGLEGILGYRDFFLAGVSW